MKLIVSISLVLLSLFKEYGADDPAREITLLYSNDVKHQQLNDEFKDVARSMGFYVVDFYIGESGVLDTIRASERYKNVVNLRVTGFCNILVYQAFLGSNLLCTTQIDPQALNFTTTKEIDTSRCDIIGPQTISLVSESIVNYNRLFEIISDSDFKIKDIVIICLPNYLPYYLENIKKYLKTYNFIDMQLAIQDDCESNLVINSSVLAVITPTTYGVESRVPMIVYNSPYILPEDKDFLPNSYNLMTSYHPLKHVLVHFMEAMRWLRVAVLSDDSEYSAVFLDDLIPLLDEKGITYTSQHCVRKNCNFTDAALTLLDASTMIVILNVNTENAMILLDYINHSLAQSVKWIVRDWPFMRNASFHEDIDMFSITLSPVFEGMNKDIMKKKPQLSGIIESLTNLRHAYRRALGDKEMFTHYLSTQMKNLRPFDTYAHITRKFKQNDCEVVASMMVRDSVITDEDRLDVYKNKPPPDLSSECIARSRNFFKPCNHEQLLFLLSVVIMFNLTILVVILFYSKYRKNAYSRLF